jgi:hypothetical protein
MRVNSPARDFADEQYPDQLQIKQEINLRQVLVGALAIAGLFALIGAQPAFADCRSEKVLRKRSELAIRLRCVRFALPDMRGAQGPCCPAPG